MVTVNRRVKFNLNNFIEELNSCLELEERNCEIDDVVQTFKTFIQRIDDNMGKKVKSYVYKHPQVINNSNLKSFISACYSDK